MHDSSFGGHRVAIRRQEVAWFVFVLVLALLARIAILLWAEWSPSRFDFPDSHRYLRVARNIVAGLGPIDSPEVRAGTDPAYPFILSLGIRLGFESDASIQRFARIVNAIAGVASVALLAGLGRRFVDAPTGLFAAGILAVDPILLYFNALVLTETLYVALLLAALYALSRGLWGVENYCGAVRQQEHGGVSRWQSSHVLWVFLAGAALGLGTITRSTALLLPLFLVPFMWYLIPRRQRIATTAILLAGAAVVMAPTVIRNHRELDRFVPVRTGSGPSLMEALGPWADGSPGMDRIVYPPMPDGVDECERDRLCRLAAWNWVRANPGEAIRLAWKKLARTWTPFLHAPGHSGGIQQVISVVTVIPAYVLAMAGAWLLLTGRAPPMISDKTAYSDPVARLPCTLPGRLVVALLLAPAAYFTLVHMVFVGSVRYRVPAMPLVFLFAGVALEWLMIRNRRAIGPGQGA